LIVNAGRGMGQGIQIADQLGAMAKQDPSLVGVVGMNQTRQATRDTISELAAVGLPTVAAALSEDSLSTDMQYPMYFQIAPQNLREAAVAEAFAQRQLGVVVAPSRSVRVYYSDDGSDVYSSNLRDDVMQLFSDNGFETSAVAFTPSGGPVTVPAHDTPGHAHDGDVLIGNASTAGRDSCGYPGFVYFAGRGLPDFADFLSSLQQCAYQPRYLIADDDVTRYVADASAREANTGPTFYYESFALAPVTNPMPDKAQNFYNQLDRTFKFENDTTVGRSFDGYAALSYDATNVFVVAAEYLHEKGNIPLTPGSVWREITAIHNSTGPTPSNDALDGATGQIDFGGDVARQVPVNKTVAILRVSQGEVDTMPAAVCGDGDAPYQPPAWCPNE
jgi:hypothetical protein